MLIQVTQQNIVHEKGNQFVISHEGVASYLMFRINYQILDLYCAYVPESSWYRGHACSLILHALQYAVLNGLRVKSSCKAVTIYLERNPEWKFILVN